jgi:tRNA1Val (adenine37-N6)-methyltransferase
MSDYLQPDFYRFNQDSLKLVSFVLNKVTVVDSLLDLGAGCGIIGLELARKLRLKKLTLLECQSDWKDYLQQNVALFLSPQTEVDIAISSFGNWNSEEKFDLIVSNPPYYLPGHGEPSVDQRKHFSRTFEHDSWEILLSRVYRNLSPSGQAFLVVKRDKRILEKVRSENLRIEMDLESDLAFITIRI